MLTAPIFYGRIISMANIIKRVLAFFGFNRNTKYVTNYIRVANVKSGIFMAAVIFILEAWLILRQFDKYIIPEWGERGFGGILYYTSTFWLFLFVGVAVFIFCLTYTNKNFKKKTKLIANAIASGIVVVYFIEIFFENYRPWTSVSNNLSNVLLLALYILSLLLALTILLLNILGYFKTIKDALFINLILILFAAMCLAFGVKVSYSDYISSNPKQIICFLTMVIYGACLLIWKPYISILVNVSLFVIFYQLVVHANIDGTSSLFQKITGQDPTTMIFTNSNPTKYNQFAETFNLAQWNQYLVYFRDGDLVNYITFFISLTMVSISLYHQRKNEAVKDEKLEYAAHFDPLTELHNFSHFAGEVEIYNKDDEMRLSHYVVFININNFKTYNYQRGFPAGNIFLKNVGALIEKHFPGQLVCRQSDDHYIAYVEKEGIEEIIKALNEDVKALDSDILPEIKVGYYEMMDRESVGRAVDKARYACSTIKDDHAKLLVEYNKSMHERYHLMQHVINSVEIAAKEGWIRPYYQPVVWSNDGTLCGVEALARWQDPDKRWGKDKDHPGLLSPGEFVPTLENTKLIHIVDACIIERVCQDLRHALDNHEDARLVPVSINFSRLDFELMDVVGFLEEVMEKYDIPKKYIHVEVTESALTGNNAKLKESVKTLKDKGYALWLDDFGSGYSSLNVLKDFEFEVIKIDMEFLRGFSQNPRTKILLQSIIQMAEKLGMRTLTEGVETEEQQHFLSDVHCERLQGYFFGKPLPHEELVKKIDSGELKVSDHLW